MCESEGSGDTAIPTPYPNDDRELGGWGPGEPEMSGGAPVAEKKQISRRSLLGGGAAFAAGVVGYRWFEHHHRPLKPLAQAVPKPAGFDGRPAAFMAMHLHASFSQGKASYLKHLSQASENQVDVVWFTEHDWRMSAKDYRTVVHFDTLDGEKEFERGWSWVEVSDPNVSGHKAAIVSSPASPNDPSPTPGALSVSAVSLDGLEASNRVFASTGQSRDNYRNNIIGQSMSIDVYPTSVGPNTWLELRLDLSDAPRVGSRAAGSYLLSYRFTSHPTAPTAQGQLGIVPIAVKVNEWNTVTLHPEEDIAKLWPDLNSRDNAVFQLWLGATSASKGTAAEGAFDYLRFHRTGVDGDQPLARQAEMLAHYRPQFPSVTAFQGLEMSFYEDHLSQFGGQLHLPPYSDPDAGDVKPPKSSSSHTPALADYIRHNGGFVSLNHPLGLAGPGVDHLTNVEQDTLRRNVTETLLPAKAYGVDAIEIGYQDRGGMLFDAHFALACTLWRNSLFVTATGASDDHNGTGWAATVNRFLTAVFTASRSQADLLQEVRAGRAFVTMLKDGPTVMDLRLDDNPMGSVSVRPGGQRTLRCVLLGLPSDGTVEVIRGTVDDAGTAALDPDIDTLASIPARQVTGGLLAMPVDARSSAFFVVRVKDSYGHTVGFTNPCWALTGPPPGGVPAVRQAPDSTV